MQNLYFGTHVHSRFSSLDALPTVDQLVARAKRFGQPGMALTDHGNMAGTVQLYKAGQKYGLQVFPGLEGYLVDDVAKKTAPRFHVGMLSLNIDGYRALMELNSLAHKRENFLRYPRFDFAMLAGLSEDKRSDGIALLTGCYFGLVQQTLALNGYDAAKRVVRMYARWFKNTFVEIQNHYIDHTETNPGMSDEFTTDADFAEALVRIADELGLPVIVTQDSHYLDECDKEAHSMMKNMTQHGDGEKAFPGDSFHFASGEWIAEHHDPKHWRKAQEAYKLLLDLHDLQMPALDTYKPKMPKTVSAPKKALRRLAYAGLDRLEKDGRLKRVRKRYEERIEHELDTINFLGMAGYFMIWVEIVEWLTQKNIAREARGSSNGSLVCYLLGITSADPLQWNLLFERFLSKDRKSPPDIDMDIEDVRRQEFVQWLKQRFGCESIGTFATLGSRSEDDKGSVLVTYNSYLRRKMGNQLFNVKYGHKGVQKIGDIKRISRREYRGVRLLAKYNTTRSYGVHASGLLLNGEGQRIADYVPTMLVASSNNTVTQFDGDDNEALGLLKLDILGQRTLTAMRNCQQMIIDGMKAGHYRQSEMALPNENDPADFNWIPLDDRQTCAEIRKGRHETGVFQFEGWSMAKGGQKLGVRSTNDCIIAGALFRPACMDSGMTDLYIRRRKFPEEREGIKYPHPAFEEVLKPTYGVVLFQEQVLEIMRRLGLDYAGINTFFKIVKDSGRGATDRNKERAAEVHKQWADICKKNGITDPDGAWHYIEGYTQYGFNKAHSTGYGLRSYRAQYLKTHFPLEYMTAILETVAGQPKEKIYIREARYMGVRLLPPDINTSGPYWTIDRKKNAIRRGLLSVESVGPTTARDLAENAPYTSIDDLVERVPGKSLRGGRDWKLRKEYAGALAKLRDAGALASLGVGRMDD